MLFSGENFSPLHRTEQDQNIVIIFLVVVVVVLLSSFTCHLSSCKHATKCFSLPERQWYFVWKEETIMPQHSVGRCNTFIIGNHCVVPIRRLPIVMFNGGLPLFTWNIFFSFRHRLIYTKTKYGMFDVRNVVHKYV